MTYKYSEEELNSAIKVCLDYLWPKQKSAIYEKKTDIIDIMNNLKNKDGSEFIHYFPYSLVFKITSGCNLRCKHCFFRDNSDSYATTDDMSEKELFEYLKFFVEDINIINCTLTGGEIFTAPYLFKFIKYLKSKNIIIELLTNGTNIKKEDAKLLAQLLNPKTDSIQISLEGPEEINDCIRGKGVFQKVKNSINLLTQNNINVCVSMTVNSMNSDKIDEMYDICKDLNVTQLNIGRMVICNDLQKDLEPDNDSLIISLARTIQKCKNNPDTRIKIRALKVFDFLMYEYGKNYINNMLETEESKLEETNLHCRSSHGQFTFFPNGDITLCYNCDKPEMIIGNVKQNSFEEIWNNRFDKLMFKKRLLNSTCKKCKYVTLCKGGCPINAYTKYKTTDAPEGNCKYAEKMLSDNIWKLEETL